MLNRMLKLAAAAAMIVATPELGAAQSIAYRTSPVAITSCSIDDSYEQGSNEDSAPQFIASAVALSFINKSEIPATTITFLVKDGGHTQSLVDKGVFRPGVRIKHNFAADSQMSTFSDATCNVTQVDFADGSSWHIASRDIAKR